MFGAAYATVREVCKFGVVGVTGIHCWQDLGCPISSIIIDKKGYTDLIVNNVNSCFQTEGITWELRLRSRASPHWK
jgi:hypothetical protein